MNKQLRYWVDAIKIRYVILGAIVYIGSVFLIAQLIIQPQYGRYHGAVEKQLEIDETYVNLLGLDIEDAVRNINGQLAELDSLEIKFEEKLLKNKRINAVFPVLDRFCTESQLKVVTLEPLNRAERVGAEYEKHLIRLSVLGKFPDFLGLLDLMESHREWILIETISIAPLEQGNYARFDLVLSVLVLMEQKA